jgi:hypothetical protein
MFSSGVTASGTMIVDDDYTVGIGPGEISIGPRQHCRTVMTRLKQIIF